MVPPRALILLLLLQSYLSPLLAYETYLDGHRLQCFSLTTPASPTPARPDCLAALAMIPQGYFLDPDHMAHHGLDASGRLPLALDRQLYSLPAAFRAGRCLIKVAALAQLPHGRNGPPRAATTLYLQVWPLARRAAQVIVDKCSVQNQIHGTFVAEAVDAAHHTVLTWMLTMEYIVQNTRVGSRFNVYTAG